MTNAKPIRRIAVFGTGVIGASWTALFLAAKGLRDRMAREIKTAISA
jgi:3-hydroxyacyl-CoA dehydrogenase